MRECSYHVPIDRISPTVRFAGFVDARKGIDFDWMTFQTFEFVYILDGTGEIEVLDRRLSFGKGDLLFTPPHLRLRYIPGGERTTHYYVHFSMFPGFEKRFSRYSREVAGFDHVNISATGTKIIPIVIHGVPKSIVSLFKTLITLSRIAPASVGADTLRIKAALIMLIDEAFSAVRRKTRNSIKFKNSIAYIDKNLSRPIRIEELALLENITPNYFSAQFHRHYGIIPVDYIATKRVESAKALIMRGGMNLHEIAQACGFRDQYYFSKVFKKITGMPPGQFALLFSRMHTAPGRQAK